MDPQDQAALNQSYQEYIKLLQIADGLNAAQARSQADLAKSAGNLSKEIKRLNKELDDTLFKSDYLYQSFRETTSELKNQNVLLQLGKSTFKGLTTIASDLNYFQQGITDLSDKQLKKQSQKLKISEIELETVKQRLSNSNGEYNRQNLLNNLLNLKRNSEERLTKEQEKLLNQLQKEKELLLSTQNALAEGIPALKEELKISKQIYDVREKVGGLAKAAAGVVSKYGGDLSRFLNVDDAIESVQEYNKQLIDGALKSKEVLDEIRRIDQDRENILANSISIQQEINKLAKDLQDANNAAQITAENNVKIQEIQNKLSRQGLLSAEEIQKLYDEKRTLQNESLRVQNLANNSVVIETKLQQAQNDLINDEIISKQKLAALDQKEQKTKQDAITSVDKLGNKFKSLGIFAKGLGTGLKKAFTDPLTIITFVIDKALEANKQTVELGKSLGYGEKNAYKFRENIASIARNSTNINVTAASLTEAFNELAQSTGLVYEFTADQLETQVKLTKQVGLQAEEAAQIQRLAVLNGTTSQKTYESFVKGLTAARNQLKVGINFKATLAEASKVSGQLAANLGYNPERIAKAVVTAKAFGMTLDQVSKSGESLLNWESSIQNELEAELLTGKQLNLERARAAALAGDQITLAEELAKNIGTSAEFTKMNVLQQKALAKSVGMEADELANTLRKREEAIASGKSLAQITEEEAKKALERQSIQDKFNQSILKLQDFFGNLIAGPVGQLLDVLSKMVGLITDVLQPILNVVFTPLTWAANKLGQIAGLLKTIAGIYLVIKGYQIASNVLEAGKTAQLALQGNALAIQNIMLEKSIVKKTMYHAIAIKEAITEEGIAGVKAYALSLDEKSLVRRTIIGAITAKEWIQQKAITIWAGVKAGYEKVSLAIQSAAAVIQKGNLLKSIGSAVMGAISSLSAIPVVGWALGLAAAGTVAALGYKFLKGDDIMSEGGYGKRTLLSPEGAIKLNDKDTVIAGTNLGGKEGKENISIPQIDLTPMITAINEVRDAVNKLYNKDTSINMDGKKVGTTLVQGSYKVA
jgi:hypothetical protein